LSDLRLVKITTIDITVLSFCTACVYKTSMLFKKLLNGVDVD